MKIVRQSLLVRHCQWQHRWLNFCAYCARLHNIEQQLLSMFGDTHGRA
ncbi:hypothetical protein ACLBOM_12680 [Escherichia coli]